ncbi:SpoIIE family protein phosphatase [Heliobacterium gestii]|uniref:SpoIIE family protein phosphatase n=1 Tax=Heliomicrobium gestii TaxID=2699 RepID=A0A845L891_HELGE|nr:PP2C family protein-serine/threonine phosphatase [Heliomicrobium gestii]MBM7866373.1 hypothetical protein [Heliomicrobium gestii]MZP42842.1 SpoIIE family protein phosphatase [Heliomicrobium gestii]
MALRRQNYPIRPSLVHAMAQSYPYPIIVFFSDARLPWLNRAADDFLRHFKGDTPDSQLVGVATWLQLDIDRYRDSTDITILRKQLPDGGETPKPGQVRKTQGTSDGWALVEATMAPLRGENGFEGVIATLRGMTTSAADAAVAPADATPAASPSAGQEAHRGGALAETPAKPAGSARETHREKDDRLAANLLHLMRPADWSLPGRWQIVGRSMAARALGGDYYDIIPIQGGSKIVLVIADVMGKGVRAALQMVMVRQVIRQATTRYQDTGGTVEAIQRGLYRDLAQSNTFVTLLYAVLDVASGRFTYVNAGHYPPLRVRDGKAEFLPGKGPALGLQERAVYPVLMESLRPGDGLLLFTDGLVDSRTAEGGRIGKDGLIRAVEAVSRETPEAPLPQGEQAAAQATGGKMASGSQTGRAKGLLDGVFETARAFPEDAAQWDDMTAVGLWREG